MSKQFTPYPYQQYCIVRIISDPHLGLFLDMGLGKTVITLTGLHSLKYYYWRIRKVLIIAPDDTCGVKTLTRDQEALKKLYSKGIRDAQAIEAFIK